MEEIPAGPPVIEVRRYPHLAEARVASLSLAALGMTYEIDPVEDEWILSVEEPRLEEALLELSLAEQTVPEPPPQQRVLGKFHPISLFVAGWVLVSAFTAQTVLAPKWELLGAARNDKILHAGEWWRVITALLLHADLSHLAANTLFGLLFAAFLLPQLGAGWSWLLIVLSGALGNLFNAWGYRGGEHNSIGASTAVFGALGLLVGCELVALWRYSDTQSRWRLIVPLGAGLALLGYLGGGGDADLHIDYMAHFWGFFCGLPMGAVAEAFRTRERLPRRAQYGAAVLALGLLAGAWTLAFTIGSL